MYVFFLRGFLQPRVLLHKLDETVPLMVLICSFPGVVFLLDG